jgi:hypothetical protein
LWALPFNGDRRPFPVARTTFVEAFGQFSPNGEWVAYQSNESGRPEVYAQPFPGPGLKLKSSTNGGAQMRWRQDGHELFYLALDSRMMAVPIRPSEQGERLVAGRRRRAAAERLQHLQRCVARRPAVPDGYGRRRIGPRTNHHHPQLESD